jgi:hypothetical protein
VKVSIDASRDHASFKLIPESEAERLLVGLFWELYRAEGDVRFKQAMERVGPDEAWPCVFFSILARPTAASPAPPADEGQAVS